MLFKRGRFWWAYFTIDGVRHQHSTGTTNRRIAERICRDLREKANLQRHGIVEFDPEVTVQDITDKFEAAGASVYNLDRLKHLLPFFGPSRVVDVIKNTALEYRAERRREKPTLKESTLNKDLAVLRHLLYWAVDAELIPQNPLVRLPMVPVRRVAKPVLGVQDEEKLLAVAPAHLKALIVAALDTGMRRGELLAQRWNHMDLARKVLSVSHSKTPDGEGREIPLTERMVGMLSAMKRDSEFVFSYRGLPMRDVKTSWNTAQRKAQIGRHFRFHDLRHTFNTRLMEAGVISDIRKALMGHNDRSVHGAYTHIELPAKREAIRKLEAWVAAEKKCAEG